MSGCAGDRRQVAAADEAKRRPHGHGPQARARAQNPPSRSTASAGGHEELSLPLCHQPHEGGMLALLFGTLLEIQTCLGAAAS